MNSKFLPALRHWAYQLFRGCLQGGAVAVKAFTATAVANAAGAHVPTLNLKETFAVFLGAAAYHAWDYISTNALPDDEGTIAPGDVKRTMAEAAVDAPDVSEIKPLILNEK